MFAFRVKAKLNREREHRMEVFKRICVTEKKREATLKELSTLKDKQCGMEKHGDSSKERCRKLEADVSTCDYELSRDRRTYDESKKKCGMLLRQLHRPARGGQVKFALLTPFL